MSQQDIRAKSIKEAVENIIPYLEDRSSTARNAIYFDGWNNGLAASALLRTIAEEPPTSLRKRFDKIVHLDCSRWKSRRVLQRTIVEQLKLPQWVLAVLDSHDEEEDFNGVDEGTRVEVDNVVWETFQAIRSLSCLVIFHNGSDHMVDFADFGFPRFDWFSPNKLLWTFRGRLRINPTTNTKVGGSQLFINCYSRNVVATMNSLLLEEAREIIQYAQQKQSITPESITPEIAVNCFLYLFWLKYKVRGIADYNWAIQASNCWVCSRIIPEGQFDKAWEVSDALLQELRIDDMSFHPMLSTYIKETDVNPELTSFFLNVQDGSYPPLLGDKFLKVSDKLRVLKLCGCKFSFYSPPFSCCHGLRFLGLYHCKDQWQEERDEWKQGRPTMEFFQSLWVLDISHTDWELDLSPDEIKLLAANIRDVHLRKGRIWANNFEWRQLKNLHKLRIIEPTCSWETGKRDEFKDMVKLDLLDLSGNITIQALPSLSSATGLKGLVLDGCVGLEHVGPLAPSLDSFRFDVRSVSATYSAKLSRVSLAGCVHLKSFLLRGALQILEELNLSGTSIKKLDLSNLVVEVPRLKKLFLMGCKQLRVILWWKGPWKLEVLCIDTHGISGAPNAASSSFLSFQHKTHDGCVVAGDARFIQSLVDSNGDLKTKNLYLDLHVPYSIRRSPTSSGSSSVIAKPLGYSDDVLRLERLAANENDDIPWPPPSDLHIEIGDGIRLTDVDRWEVINVISHVIYFLISSMHVHDNSCMLDIMPKEPSFTAPFGFVLEWCRVERCPGLQAVFAASDNSKCRYYFPKLEKFWASDLLAACCIWGKGVIHDDGGSFYALRTMHVHNCPRIKFVLPFSSEITLPSLETLHISRCSDLRQVFPWDSKLPQEYKIEEAVKELPKLKHIHLHDLPSLQEICAAMMYAPMLESVKLRGCWSLRSLPAVGHRRPIVDCEKDCWEKLKWEGHDANHHPSLYQPYHSSYYKERRLRGAVLR